MLSKGIRILAFVTSCALSGCSYLITTLAEKETASTSKTLKFNISQEPGFSACVQNSWQDTSKGICPVPPGAAADVLYPHGKGASPNPVVTTSVRPKGRKPSINPAADAPANADALNKEYLATITAADAARAVLNDPVQTKLNAIFNFARGSVTADSPGPASGVIGFGADGSGKMSINMADFNQYIDKVESATLMGGWDALAAEPQIADTAPSPEESRRAQYISAYFKAYFRQGKFFQATIDYSRLKSDIVGRLKSSIPGLPAPAAGQPDPYETLAESLFGATLGLCDKTTDAKCDLSKPQSTFGSIGTQGLVARDGQSVEFPSITASYTPGAGRPTVTKVDYTAVGSDLVRVLLYAIYDAHDQIPSVSNATGATDAQISQTLRLIPNDPTKTKVSADDFQEIETISTQIEGVTSAGVGKVLRGVGFVALNNEALATVIETAVGVAVRKHSEKILWCWYACAPSALVESTKDGAFTATNAGTSVTLDISIVGEPSKTLGAVRSK